MGGKTLHRLDADERPHPNDTTGDHRFPIEGPMKRENYRAGGLTDEERKWRKQWNEDQLLSQNEPRPFFLKMEASLVRNPIKAVVRFPLDMAFTPLLKHYPHKKVYAARFYTGKLGLAIGAVLATVYYFKYNRHDWLRNGGWQVTMSRPRVLPSDAGYPYVSEKSKPTDYYDIGFKNSSI